MAVVTLRANVSTVDTARPMKVRNDSKVKAKPEMFARYSRTANSFEFGKQTENVEKNIFGNKARQITKLVNCLSTASIEVNENALDIKELLVKILYFRGYHANDVLFNDTLAANNLKGTKYKTSTGEIKKHSGTNKVAVNVRIKFEHWAEWLNINTIEIKKVFKYEACTLPKEYFATKSKRKKRSLIQYFDYYDIFIDSKTIEQYKNQISNLNTIGKIM